MRGLQIFDEILGVWRSAPCKSVDGGFGKNIHWKNLPVMASNDLKSKLINLARKMTQKADFKNWR